MALRRRLAKLVRVLGDPTYRAALSYGVAASVELEPVPFAQHVRTIIDVGANRGQFATFALRRFPAATIHCFEPLPAPAARLAQVAREVGAGRVRVHAVGLGEREGRAVMHVTRDDDSSSLLPLAEPQRRRGSVEVARVEVDVRRLDAVLSLADVARPALLKVDVQGSELDVLRGATGVLDAIDEILVECSYVPFYEGQALAPDVIAHLADHGFAVRHVLPSIVSGDRVQQADILFGRVS